MDDHIFCGRHRHRDREISMMKFDGIQDDLALGVGLD
jgi:hypothetical protein